MARSNEDILRSFRKINRMSRKSNRYKSKKESTDKYIIRKNNKTCVYCRSKNKKLNTSVEPYHRVNGEGDVKFVLNKYNLSYNQLKKMNKHVDFNDLKGAFLNVPMYYKIFPNTHGICYCSDCGKKRFGKGLTHAEYLTLVLEKRKLERNRTEEVKREVFDIYGHKCVYCEIEYGKQIEGRKITFDHKIAISRGGESTVENGVPACQEHNIEKADMSYERYIQMLRKRRDLIEKEIGQIGVINIK